MREIKYRGLSNGKWIIGNLFIFTGNINKGQCYISDYGSMVDHSLTNDMNDAAIGFFKRVDSETVGQYTGLKDKDGVEIYEGDIIWDAHAEIHGKVTFDEGSFCVEWETHIEHLFEVIIDGYAEVLGNIFENTELLQEVDLSEL